MIPLVVTHRTAPRRHHLASSVLPEPSTPGAAEGRALLPVDCLLEAYGEARAAT